MVRYLEKNRRRRTTFFLLNFANINKLVKYDILPDEGEGEDKVEIGLLA
jgi:hypothetical protein